MATFNPNGRVHAILERLVEGDAPFLSLANAAGCGLDKHAQKKLWHAVGALLHHELIGGKRARYYLLPAGRQLLDGLRAGRSITIEEPVASVRRFA